MARNRKASDSAYNARRRYGRAAERYIKKANQSSGATAERYKALARENYEKAMRTYDPKTTQNVAGRLREVGNALGAQLTPENMRTMINKDISDSRRRNLIESSTQSLEGTDDVARREREARTLLSNTNVGHKIMAGLIEVWEGAEDREQAILDYFGADSLADVIDTLEEKLGDRLYATDDIGSTYAIVKLEIQNMVADNSLIA